MNEVLFKCLILNQFRNGLIIEIIGEKKIYKRYSVWKSLVSLDSVSGGLV